MPAKKEDIVSEVKRLVDCNTEMIEWRVDAFENVNSVNAVREVLNEIKTLVEETILCVPVP